MPTIISNPGVKRNIEGFNALDFNVADFAEQDLLVIEPAFVNFRRADDTQLGAPFSVISKLGTLLPKLININITYNPTNARVFNGYLLDLVNQVKSKGYVNFTSVHVPYESYGAPITGSVVQMLFSASKFSYVPKKKLVYPAEVMKDLKFHAPNGRNMGSVFRGTSALYGFLNSERAFLPHIDLWGKKIIRAEYLDGKSLSPETIRKSDILRLFGCSSYDNVEALALCTPAAIIAQLENVKFLG